MRGKASYSSVYLQAQHDYLQGNYPVVRDDAAQMCALQMQADAGPTYLESIDTIEQAVERFITKPVSFQLRTFV